MSANLREWDCYCSPCKSLFFFFQLELFKKKNADTLATAKRAVEQALETTNSNIAWMNKNYDNIVQWLEDNNKEH